MEQGKQIGFEGELLLRWYVVVKEKGKKRTLVTWARTESEALSKQTRHRPASEVISIKPAPHRI